MIQFNGGLVAKNSLWSPVRIPAGWFCPKKREKNASKRFRNNHPLLGAKARSFLYTYVCKTGQLRGPLGTEKSSKTKVQSNDAHITIVLFQNEPFQAKFFVLI